MKILLATSEDGENIGVVKDYSEIKDKGEVAHFLVELEFIKEDLLDIWAELNFKDTDERGY